MAANQRDEQVVEFAEFAGLRNTTTPERFDPADLAVAQNVDLDDSKQLLRRKGLALVREGAYSGIWSNGTHGFAVKGTSLIQINADGSETALRSGLVAGDRPSFASVTPDGRVYCACSAGLRVIEFGADRTWGLDLPYSTGIPVVSSNGLLRAGTYLVALAYVSSDGQISGSTPPMPVEIPGGRTGVGGGFDLRLIPKSSDSRVVATEVYISDCNGETLYSRGRVTTSTEFAYHTEVPPGRALTTQHLGPPPSGATVVAYAFGRTFVAVGDALFPSEPWSPELFDYRKQVRFGSAITLIAPQYDGVYLGTENAVSWHAGGTPETWTLAYRLNYGAIRGTLSTAPADWVKAGAAGEVSVFMTTQGVVVAGAGGEVANVTQDRFLFPAQPAGVGLARRHRGFSQYLVALQGPETAAQAAV